MLATCLLDSQNILGEGPLWDHRTQLLYWVDIPKAHLHSLDPVTHQYQMWHMSEAICCIGLHGEGGLIAAGKNGFGTIELPQGKFIPIDTSFSTPQKVMFNDGKVDPQGRFWVGTKDLLEQQPLGSLYRLDLSGGVKEMDHGFTVANGMAWSLDHKIFYFTDSPARTIYQYDFEPGSGDVSNRRVFATIPTDAGYPDGLTIDSEGHLWSAHWSGSRITRYKPNGEIERVVAMPVEYPTSCCFGGKDLKTLFVTSARRDLTPEQLARSPHAGSLFAIETDVKGLPEPLFLGI